VEYEMPVTNCAFSTFKNLLNDLVFPGELEEFFAEEGYDFNPGEGHNFTPPATIQYIEGGGNPLFRIIAQGALEIIEIDAQHPYIEQLPILEAQEWFCGSSLIVISFLLYLPKINLLKFSRSVFL
jgi:hypothetical protein